jgi:hypothetical protein
MTILAIGFVLGVAIGVLAAVAWALRYPRRARE